jgi:hypothetical protein
LGQVIVRQDYIQVGTQPRLVIRLRVDAFPFRNITRALQGVQEQIYIRGVIFEE